MGLLISAHRNARHTSTPQWKH